MSTNANSLFSFLLNGKRLFYATTVLIVGSVNSAAWADDEAEDDRPPSFPALLRPINATPVPSGVREIQRPARFPTRPAAMNQIGDSPLPAPSNGRTISPPMGSAPGPVPERSAGPRIPANVLPAPSHEVPMSSEGEIYSDSEPYIGDPGYGDWFDGVGCGPGRFCGGRLWVRPEFALWWVQGMTTPPLVTSSPGGTAQNVAGRLGQPTTTVLFGDDNMENSARAGARLRLGYWLDACQTHGIDVTYLGLGAQETNFSASSTGSPILARPFYNLEPGFVGQDAEFVAFPGLLQGGIQIHSNTTFEMMEVLYRHAFLRDGCSSIDFLVGYRYNRLSDQLSITDSKTSIGTGSGIAVGTTIQETDNFNTRNTFNGVEFGFTRESFCGCWSLELMSKIALGITNTRTDINGQTTVSVPVPGAAPNVSVTPAGLLVQQTNAGVRDEDLFAVIPELGVTVGYSFTQNLRATMGYSFMYWSSVARSGNLIDTQLNLSQLTPAGLTGPAHPAYFSNTSGVWAQGFSFGLNYQF